MVTPSDQLGNFSGREEEGWRAPGRGRGAWDPGSTGRTDGRTTGRQALQPASGHGTGQEDRSAFTGHHLCLEGAVGDAELEPSPLCYPLMALLCCRGGDGASSKATRPGTARGRAAGAGLPLGDARPRGRTADWCDPRRCQIGALPPHGGSVPGAPRARTCQAPELEEPEGGWCPLSAFREGRRSPPSPLSSGVPGASHGLRSPPPRTRCLSTR